MSPKPKDGLGNIQKLQGSNSPVQYGPVGSSNASRVPPASSNTELGLPRDLQQTFDSQMSSSPTKEDLREEMEEMKFYAQNICEMVRSEAKQALDAQNFSFQEAAAKYEIQARDVAQVELAQTEVRMKQ